MLGLVVDAAHQRILNADAALGSQIVVVSRIQHLSGVETLVHRHQLVTQFVAGSVKRYRQTHRNAFCGELFDSWNHTDRGYSDITCGDAETFRWHGTDLPDRAQYGPVIAHWFAHAHEHDIAQTSGTAGNLAVAHGLRRYTHLLDDLPRGHVTCQSKLAGGAERTAHTATHLAGNAERGACRITHQHGFD